MDADPLSGHISLSDGGVEQHTPVDSCLQHDDSGHVSASFLCHSHIVPRPGLRHIAIVRYSHLRDAFPLLSVAPFGGLGVLWFFLPWHIQSGICPVSLLRSLALVITIFQPPNAVTEEFYSIIAWTNGTLLVCPDLLFLSW